MGSMEKECNKSFLKSVHIWRQSQWILSNNRGKRIPIDISKSNQYLVTSNWVIGQRVQWELLNNSGYFQDCTLLHTIWWEVPTAEKKIYTTQWTWRSKGCTYIEPSNLCNSIFSRRRYSASYPRRKKKHKQQAKHKFFYLQLCTSYEICWFNAVTSIGIVLRTTSWDETHTPHSLCAQGPEITQLRELWWRQIVLFLKSNKITPNDILLQS